MCTQSGHNFCPYYKGMSRMEERQLSEQIYIKTTLNTKKSNYSKCPPFAFTHFLKWPGHSSIAALSTSRVLMLLTSPNPLSVSQYCDGAYCRLSSLRMFYKRKSKGFRSGLPEGQSSAAMNPGKLTSSHR